MDNPFDAATPTYDRVRPSYPRAAVDLCLRAPTREVRDVVEFGAGTGKLTALLLRRGLRITAVEPARAMRAQMRSALVDPPLHEGGPAPATPPTGGGPSPAGGPGARLRVLDAGAEDTGLAAGCADLVVSAQAWHWFDGPAAGAEAARLLRPGGALAVVFNQMDVSRPWIHRLTRIMRSGDVHREDTPPRVGPLLTEPRVTVLRWTQGTTPEDLLALARTRSSYLASGRADRERMQANLRWYLHDHLGLAPADVVEVPYLTLVWTSTPAGR